MHTDKAGKELWDSIWEGEEIPEPIDPHQPGFRNAKTRRYHQYFTTAFANLEPRNAKLLEIGCAKSQFLPYFAKEFGFDIYGLDYSEIGCEQSRQILTNASVAGEIVCADFFAPPDKLIGTFDVVFSFGVAEHFEPTTSCLSAFSKFLKPGGLIITIIPNMTGLDGQIQKMFDRKIFDIHVLLDAKQLATAHQQSNFQITNCNYFISADFSIPNLSGLDPQQSSTKFKQFCLNQLSRIGTVILALEERLFQLPATRYFSPSIICCGTRQ